LCIEHTFDTLSGMRWKHLQLAGADGDGLFDADTVVRTFDTPQFRGLTFYEVRARSIVNRVPAGSGMPFEWTVNPYRGCSHACVYCFARNTHTYLDLDAGRDFDTRIIVKVNAAELLRRELAAPRWPGAPIAMGTNVDPYQRAEGRYALMPGVLAALRDARNPFSILTKGALILRDLDLLRAAAEVTAVTTSVSVGFLDRELASSVEPGAPGPRRRLEVCRSLRAAGLRCGVLMAPVLPYLTDSPAQLEQTVRAVAEAGATSIAPIVLHLRPGAREWFLRWLGERHPALLGRYRELYGRSSYAPKPYQDRITGMVHELARRYGLNRLPSARAGPPSGLAPAVGARQPALL
jgi:DNA repair photolyase